MRRYYSAEPFLSLILFARVAVTSTESTLTWTSPQSGEQFISGQPIDASWQSSTEVSSPSFSLCVQVAGTSECGDPIWPSVIQNNSTQGLAYSMIIIAPNVTVQESFFIKMKSDAGDSYMSPSFSLAPTGSLNVTATAVSASASPTATAAMMKTNTPGTNPLAIGIPVTMLAMALLGGLAFCLTRNKRKNRDDGGAASNSLAPSTRASLSTCSSASQIDKGHFTNGSLETGEATFFNISLKKMSELSEVEKGVCGTLASTAASQSTLEQSRKLQIPHDDFARARRPISSDEEYFTKAPQRVWPRAARTQRGHRDRSWIQERQRQRAMERDEEVRWEQERWDHDRKRTQTYGSPYISRYGYDDDKYRPRSAPIYRGSRAHSGEPLDQRGDSWTTSHRRRPPSFPVYGYSPESCPSGPDPRDNIHQYSNSRIPPALGSRPMIYPTPSAAPMDHEHHSTLSVVSAYLAPSPYLSSASGFPNSPYVPSPVRLEEDIPASLQAGFGRVGLEESRFPPGLDQPQPRSRELIPETAGHGHFDFEQRQASQFAFSRIGSAVSNIPGPSEDMQPGFSRGPFDKPLPRCPA